jgi:hypothetical protein
LDHARTVSGINFAPDFPRQSFGDYGNDAILINFSENWERLTILFFKGQKAGAQTLFQRWIAGALPENTMTDFLPVETKKAG